MVTSRTSPRTSATSLLRTCIQRRSRRDSGEWGGSGRGVACARPALFATLVLTLAAGCVDLDKFETGDDSVFAGRVLGAADDDCAGESSCSFIRRGFGSDTLLEMTFHPNQAQSVPGNLTTRDEPCDVALDNVPMEPITPLAHDQLGLYDFPGGTRVRNYIYALRPTTGPLADRDVMAFVSLLTDGEAEVRIVTGSGAVQCDPTDCATINSGGCDYYGLFLLGREPR